MAATQKQIDANRKNAQKSTGPRTPEGKARVSLNAIKHGLAAGPATILPHENRAEYEAMKAGLTESWQPVNHQEVQLVDAIADGWLRMQRALRFEAATLNLNIRDLKRRRRVSKTPAPVTTPRSPSVWVTPTAILPGCSSSGTRNPLRLHITGRWTISERCRMIGSVANSTARASRRKNPATLPSPRKSAGRNLLRTLRDWLCSAHLPARLPRHLAPAIVSGRMTAGRSRVEIQM